MFTYEQMQRIGIYEKDGPGDPVVDEGPVVGNEQEEYDVEWNESDGEQNQEEQEANQFP